MHHSPRRALVTLTALAVVASLAAACSSEDASPRPAGGGDAGDDGRQPAVLEPAWTTTVASSFDGRGFRPVADGYVFTRYDGVLRLTADGTRQWSRPLRNACATAVNAAGDVAVTSGRKCRAVSVLDGATGKVRWTTRVPLVSQRYDSGDMRVSIGDRAVSLVQFCGQVTRLAVRDGRQLGILAPHDRKCGNEADSDGRTVAIWRDPEDAATPDDHGTGWIPQTPGVGAFELYDADSGRLLWRREADRQLSSLREGAVVSSDPLVLALEEHGRTTLRRFTRTSARPGRPVGRLLGAHDGSFTSIGTADGVLLGTFSSSAGSTGPRLHAFDLTTGAELWSRDLVASGQATSFSLAGTDEDGVVVSVTQPGGDDRTWLLRWDLRTGEDAGVIGVLTEPANAFALEGGAVLVAGRDSVAKVPVGTADPEVVVPVGDDPGWSADDVRAMADCTAITDETLRLLGLAASAGLPTPADCTWREREPSYSDRDLSVEVTIAAPAGIGDRTTPASEAAGGTVDQLLERQASSTDVDGAGLPDPQPLDGLGDEAHGASHAHLRGSNSDESSAFLVVRVRNVVVAVRSTGRFDVARRHAAPAPLENAEDGVLRAAREVLASYGLSLGDGPERAADGTHTDVPDVCRLLAADARAAGLGRPTDVTRPGSGPRISSCAWTGPGELNDELVVHAYAVDGGLFTDDTADQRAQAVLDGSSHERARPLPGFGDRAAIVRIDASEARDGYDNSWRQVWVRSGNLLVNLDLSRWGAGLGARTEAEALRLTRKVLRASRS